MDFNAGGPVPGPSTVKPHGRCPLDGYPLIYVDGGVDHVIPLAEDEVAAAPERIASAHGR
jgi:hypothetical protein